MTKLGRNRVQPRNEEMEYAGVDEEPDNPHPGKQEYFTLRASHDTCLCWTCGIAR